MSFTPKEPAPSPDGSRRGQFPSPSSKTLPFRILILILTIVAATSLDIASGLQVDPKPSSPSAPPEPKPKPTPEAQAPNQNPSETNSKAHESADPPTSADLPNTNTPDIAAKASTDNELRVVIDEIKHTRGKLVVALFDNEEGFLKEPLWHERHPVTDARPMIITIKKPVPDHFALTVYQDYNENEKLDRGLFRRPLEPYGFSRNPEIRFAPPSFEEASVHKDTLENPLKIRLKR